MSEYFQNIVYTVKSVLTGMSLTWDHFINKKKHVSTLQYPNEKWPQTDRSIGFDHSEYNVIRSRLHVDIDDCIGCLQCEKACPVDCIKIDTIKPPKDSEFDCGTTSHDTQKKMIVPRFSIDMSECMYCNLCVYPCPEECIYMVGGPNEPKHEIDYEFSKYVKHDLVFEFSNVTNKEIIDIGGESYLEKRKEIENKIIAGNDLKGVIEGEGEEISGKEGPQPSKHVDPGFEVFKVVSDKMSRGIAKKAYTYGRRNNMDMVAISKYVEEAINSYNKMSPDMEEAIKLIVDFKYPEEIDKVQSPPLKKDTIDSSNEKTVTLDKSSLFNIKELNDISDKMIRGSVKKIYMGGKRLNKTSLDIIEEIKMYLNENNQMSDEIQGLLNNIDIQEDKNQTHEKNIEPDVKINEDSLFDIKLLNDIEDRVIRATSKKIYMAGKRSGKNTPDVIDDIINTLKETGKLNEQIEDMLKGVK